MAISLYDVTITSYLQTLGAVAAFLEKARAQYEAEGKDPESILGLRLFDDMLPFTFQIVSVAHHSRGAVAAAKSGVAGIPNPPADPTFAVLQGLVNDAIAELKAVKPEEINALEGGDVVFKIGERALPFTAENYLLSFSLPNFHFHATTAYDILRREGVKLGKRDYLGAMRLKM